MDKTLYLDCFSGISGDMMVGALLDAGLDLEYLTGELKKINLDGYEIRKYPVMAGAITDSIGRANVIKKIKLQQKFNSIIKNVNNAQNGRNIEI